MKLIISLISSTSIKVSKYLELVQISVTLLSNIDPGNDISARDIELMELTHDVAFSQYSDLLQISDDEQPPIKKSAKPKISKDTFNCTDCEVQANSKFKLNGHQKRKHPTPRTNQRGGGQQDLLTNHLFLDAQPSGSRQPQSQQQQQPEDKEFEDFK